jgi:hypothetical protein
MQFFLNILLNTIVINRLIYHPQFYQMHHNHKCNINSIKYILVRMNLSGINIIGILLTDS